MRPKCPLYYSCTICDRYGNVVIIIMALINKLIANYDKIILATPHVIFGSISTGRTLNSNAQK